MHFRLIMHNTLFLLWLYLNKNIRNFCSLPHIALSILSLFYMYSMYAVSFTFPCFDFLRFSCIGKKYFKMFKICSRPKQFMRVYEYKYVFSLGFLSFYVFMFSGLVIFVIYLFFCVCQLVDLNLRNKWI